MNDREPIPLLLCPWCWSDKVHTYTEEVGTEANINSVFCDGCEATGPSVPGRQAAAQAWNRLPRGAPIQHCDCPECCAVIRRHFPRPPKVTRGS